MSAATPAPVAGDLVFKDIAVGAWHACGVTTDGDVYCWGAVEWDDEFDDSTETRLSPVRVESDVEFATVAAGFHTHTCALDTDGRAYCWGFNGDMGLLGDGSTETRAEPMPVAGDLTFRGLSAAGFYTCGVTTNGEAYCWGKNSKGELGDGTTDDRLTPTRVGGAGGPDVDPGPLAPLGSCFAAERMTVPTDYEFSEIQSHLR